MAPADDVDGAAKASPLFAKYGTRADAESAREQLAARMETAAHRRRTRRSQGQAARRRASSPAAPGASAADAVGDFLGSRQGKALQREVMRGVFGMLRKRL